MLKLDIETRRRHGLSSEFLGLVHRDGRFRHAKCHDSVQDLVARLAAEDDHIAVASTDDWRGDVGPCDRCGRDADEGRP